MGKTRPMDRNTRSSWLISWLISRLNSSSSSSTSPPEAFVEEASSPLAKTKMSRFERFGRRPGSVGSRTYRDT